MLAVRRLMILAARRRRYCETYQMDCIDSRRKLENHHSFDSCIDFPVI